MKFITDFLYWLKTEESGLEKRLPKITDLHFRDLILGEYKPQWKSKTLAPTFHKNQLGHANCSFQQGSNNTAVYFGENISARWLTAKAFQQGLCNVGGGADIESWAKVARKFGVVLESDCPSDETLPWDVYVKVDFKKLDSLAEQKKIGSYHWIRTVSEVYQALDLGYAVCIGRTWLTSMNTGGGFARPWIIQRSGLPVGGHCTLAIGYQGLNDIELNSYGGLWGDGGRFYCPMSSLQKDIDDYGALVIDRIPYTPKEIILTGLKKTLSDLLKSIKNMNIPTYLWDTVENTRHSCRVIMDTYNLTWPEKDLLCAVIMAESGMKIKAVNHNENGSSDYGLVQINDGFWIGVGKPFSSVEDVFDHPEKSVKFMVDAYLKGNLKWWCAYTNGSYKKYL